MDRRLSIYILKCTGNKYYVGKSRDHNIRIAQHFSGEGSSWTKMYKPLKIVSIISNCDAYDEDKYTLMYMNKYGINNVRGGTYSKIVLESYHVKTLKDQLKTVKNLCYVCGSKSHFASGCNKRYKD